MKKLALIVALLLPAYPALADAPEVVRVTATPMGMGWTFSVTLSHNDTGWDHYADGWEIVDAEGTVLGARKLHHPHVDEQPFTRSLNNVMLEDGTQRVYLRVHCSQHGWKKHLHEIELKR